MSEQTMNQLDEKLRGFEALKQFLANLRPSQVVQTEAERLLTECWHEFEGNGETSMDGHKLLNRTEAMQWNAPYLTFRIERHGGTVAGSIYAEIQSWTLDLDCKTARVEVSGKRQLEAKARAMKTAPLAETICKLILDRTEDSRLVWKDDRKVRIDIEKVIPATNQQTTSSRRKRFRTDLQTILSAHGWRMTTINTFERE
jgi:hypothetical protein